MTQRKLVKRRARLNFHNHISKKTFGTVLYLLRVVFMKTTKLFCFTTFYTYYKWKSWVMKGCLRLHTSLSLYTVIWLFWAQIIVRNRMVLCFLQVASHKKVWIALKTTKKIRFYAKNVLAEWLENIWCLLRLTEI